MPAALTNQTARAAADLLAIREQWGDLLTAIDGPRDRTWPPRETRNFLDKHDEGSTGRLPLVLREHPAPVNLDALDAAEATERDLFDLADRIADAVQRPVRYWIGLAGDLIRDDEDGDDPRRWHLPTHRSATLIKGDGIAESGSRAHGLHWAAVWIEGRLTNDGAHGGALLGDTGLVGSQPPLFRPMPLRLADEAAATIRQCAQRVERALNRDVRITVLDRPCPWCAGQLTARSVPGAPERTTISCKGGHDCGAPVPVEAGRRVWRAVDIPGLHGALTAAEQHAEG